MDGCASLYVYRTIAVNVSGLITCMLHARIGAFRLSVNFHLSFTVYRVQCVCVYVRFISFENRKLFHLRNLRQYLYHLCGCLWHCLASAAIRCLQFEFVHRVRVHTFSMRYQPQIDLVVVAFSWIQFNANHSVSDSLLLFPFWIFGFFSLSLSPSYALLSPHFYYHRVSVALCAVRCFRHSSIVSTEVNSFQRRNFFDNSLIWTIFVTLSTLTLCYTTRYSGRVGTTTTEKGRRSANR